MRPMIAATLLVLSTLFTPVANANAELYQLSFNNTEQKPVSLSQFKGKVILLNFWATWCPPCVKEMPTMERLRQHFTGQPFEIVAINAGEPGSKVDTFLANMKAKGHPLTFPVLLDEKGRSFREFGLRGLPMSFIFGKDGELIETVGGGVEWDSAENIGKIETLLKN